MKKLVSILLCCLVSAIVLCSAACSSDGNKNLKLSSISLNYMNDLMLDLDGNTALGIKKAKTDNTESTLSLNKNYAVELLATPLSNSTNSNKNNGNLKERFYLYSTTQKYSNSFIENENATIKKVTFQKSTQATDNVYDGNGNLIDNNMTVNQDDLNAQVNKLYVTKKFTFIQFVALVEKSGYFQYNDEQGKLQEEYIELRPDSLNYDENGVASFDKTNYYSGAFSQSFVIDNATGLIYSIEDINIAKICDTDIVKDNQNNYYKISIKDNKLIITDVLPNKNITIIAIVTDNYGYTFIQNDSINNLDKANKIYYHTEPFLIDKDKKVYTWKYDNGTFMENLTGIFIDGSVHDLSDDYTAYGIEFITAKYNADTNVGYLATFTGCYKGHRVYNGNLYTPAGVEFIENSLYIETNSIHCHWLDGDFSTLTLIGEADGYLYYKIINIDEYLGKNVVLELKDFTKLCDFKVSETDYNLNIDGGSIELNNVYESKTLTTTNYYQLFKTGNSCELKLLENKEYTQNVFILQPIN